VTINPRSLACRVEDRICGYARPTALVALSGGVDSSVVLALAARAIGSDAVTAVTAVSPSYPAGELEAAREVAAFVGTPFRVVRTGEVDREAYARNDGRRCFHCKAELYGVLRRLSTGESRGQAAVLSGANADDQLDVRPGLVAGAGLGVKNPLLEEGIGKHDVRAVARMLHLPVADKPALACLSSRVAFGIRITSNLLGRIDRAEGAVRALGFATVRVRHLGEVASIEVPATDVARLMAHPELPAIEQMLRDLGWSRVEIDPRGYRQGSMNATLIRTEPLTIRR
jgi:uncharacterized protein